MEKSFEVLVREYEPALRAFVIACLCRRYDVVDETTASDLVQETFVAAWREFDRYDNSRPFAAWLRGIARNKILMHARSAATADQHVRFLSPEAVEAISDSFAPLTRRGDTFSECLSALRTCLAVLSGTDRRIIEDAYGRRQSCPTIADQLGQSADAVRKRLQRARLQLRECILAKLRMGEPGV
ncbi:MAG: sigma-70 family RNA polymerase sigma factor [Phycisphaerae bacterium]|jgi:RNA polymerase sigma-70 factor (ECF subfamily)